MTNTEYKEMLKRKLEELQKQGKNPHAIINAHKEKERK